MTHIPSNYSIPPTTHVGIPAMPVTECLDKINKIRSELLKKEYQLIYSLRSLQISNNYINNGELSINSFEKRIKRINSIINKMINHGLQSDSNVLKKGILKVLNRFFYWSEINTQKKSILKLKESINDSLPFIENQKSSIEKQKDTIKIQKKELEDKINELQDIHIDDVSTNNAFVKKTLKHLMESSLYNSKVDYALEKEVLNRLKGVNDLDKSLIQKFQGFTHYSFDKHISLRAQHIESLVTKSIIDNGILGISSEKEKNQLLELHKHRQILSRYAQLTDLCNDNSNDCVVKQIQNDLSELSKDDSSKVVKLRNGDKSFSLPGIWSGHYVTYTFKKKGDKYYFIIDNRGRKLDDYRLHQVHHLEHRGKWYAPTRVEIEVSLDALSNEEFLSSLVGFESFGSKNPNHAYDYVYHHLIKLSKGKLIENKHKAELDKLYRYLNNNLASETTKVEIRKYADSLIKSSNLHSIQIFGSCAISSSTPIEKDILTPSVMRAVKKFELEASVDSLNKSASKDNPETQLLIKRAQEKIESLDVKLRHSKSLVGKRKKAARGRKKLSLLFVKAENEIREKWTTLPAVELKKDNIVPFIQKTKKYLKNIESIKLDTNYSIEMLNLYIISTDRQVNYILEREDKNEFKEDLKELKELKVLLQNAIQEEQNDIYDLDLLKVKEELSKFKHEYFKEDDAFFSENNKTFNKEEGHFFGMLFTTSIDQKIKECLNRCESLIILLEEKPLSKLFMRRIKQEFDDYSKKMNDFIKSTKDYRIEEPDSEARTPDWKKNWHDIKLLAKLNEVREIIAKKLETQS
ncbi:MAG: hypothetical protein H0W88_12265 [Parachlamydiaceae bacterium]|nr:hypothetical protein [Parachlamydiaceae bacterium]